MFAFLVAARFPDPIVSLPPYQFARDSQHYWDVAALTVGSPWPQPELYVPLHFLHRI